MAPEACLQLAARMQQMFRVALYDGLAASGVTDLLGDAKPARAGESRLGNDIHPILRTR